MTKPSPFSRAILDRTETREGAGTYILACGHQVAVTGTDWGPRKRKVECVHCKENAAHEAGNP